MARGAHAFATLRASERSRTGVNDSEPAQAGGLRDSPASAVPARASGLSARHPPAKAAGYL